MQSEAVPSKKHGTGLLHLLLVGTFADLGILLVVILAHAITSIGALLLPAELLTLLLAFLSVASVLAGIVYAWRGFPQHRRAIVFVVTVTLVTLLAHAYLIGSPPAYTTESLSGGPGTSFYDDHVNVSSSLSGTSLSLTVTTQIRYGSNGQVTCCAIANLEVADSSGKVLSGGVSAPPTLASPLQPGESATGVWTISSTHGNLSLTYQLLNCYSLSSKAYGCIMDEVFYVPEGMGILTGQHCSTGPSAPSNCHMEHPPLVPAMMAAGMGVLGEYNAAGWRLFPALLGTFSIPLLFGIVWKISGSKKAAYLSATLLALDIMFFSQSSGGLLDIPEVFFGLAAFFTYFAGVRFWKFDKYVVSGILLGVAGLAKETAIFFAMGFLTYVLLFGEGKRSLRVYHSFKVALVIILVFAAGLQAYDSTLASPAVPTFVQHIEYILSYGSSLVATKLACQPTTGYWCKFPNDAGGPPILPTDWLLYYSPVAYYATSVSVCSTTVNGVCQGGQYSYVALAYYGVTNLLETWTVFVWVPLVAYALYHWRKRPQPSLEQPGLDGSGAGMPADLKFAALALVWFFWAYLPYIALFLGGRVTYPFYFVPAIPAVAMGAAWWLTRSWFPRWLLAAYLVMVFVFFLVYFPDKSFLPVWLRVLIGH